MSANGRNRGYIGRNRTNSPTGVLDGRQSYLNEEVRSYNYGPDWARPADWLAVPGYTFGEQVVYALVAVTDDESQSNSIGLQVSGNYTVDWGDGATGSFSAGTSARRTYNYSSISSSTQTSEGFRQVLVKITPQSGQNITSLNFAIAGITTASADMPSKFLELNMNTPNCSNFTFLANFSTSPNPWIRKIFINRIASGGNNINFGYLTNLQSLYYPPTGWNPNNGTGLFQLTPNLKSLPPLLSLGGSNTPSLFAGSGIEVLPNWNYSSLSDIGRLAQNSSIKSIPFILTINSNITSATVEWFRDCFALEYVKGLNFPNTTNTALVFTGCRALKEVEGITFSRSTSFAFMFADCWSLEKIGYFNGGTGCQSIQEMFSGCRRLKTAPPMDLRNCTQGYRAFVNCSSLENVPGYTFGPGAYLENMFGGCYSLKKLPEMNFGNVRVLDTGVGSGQRFTFGCFALERFPVKNLKVSWNLSNSRFGFTALSEIFAGLSGASGGAATLNITGNPGATFITAAQIAGATALGWTITR